MGWGLGGWEGGLRELEGGEGSEVYSNLSDNILKMRIFKDTKII